MTLARVERPTLGPSPWHRHRGTWVEHWRPAVWMAGAGRDRTDATLTRGRIHVRIRRCDCGRVDIREQWPGGKRKTTR